MTDERKKPGPKPKLPKVSVLDRRKLHPFGAPSQAVTLKTPGQWATRIVNTKSRTGRLHDVLHNKGWAYVLPEELDGAPDELGFESKDGRLLRGEHGEEVLVKMPQKDFDEIQSAKARLNIKNLGGKQMREAVAQTTALEHGDQAGETVARQFDHIEVTDGRERVELEPEPAA